MRFNASRESPGSPIAAAFFKRSQFHLCLTWLRIGRNIHGAF
jgi:hypothetical protein